MDTKKKNEMLEKEFQHIHEMIMKQEGHENILHYTEALVNIVDMMRTNLN